MFIVGVTGLSSTGWALPLVMTTLLTLVLVYTVLGGMISVVVTDYLQFVVLSCGMLLATALAEAGPPGPVLLAAHGSKVSKTSGDTTYQIAATLEARGFGPVHPAFVEQAPFLQEVAQKMVSGTCLPFFALRAGHVAQDVPDALQAAGFSGPLLPPIGEATGTAALIAAALIAALARRD